MHSPENFSNKSRAYGSEFLNHTHSRINSRFKRRSFDVVNFVARIKPEHLQQSASAAGSRTSIRGIGPGDIKSKINSLIQAQVASGALTSNQATELQNLFSNTFGNGPGGSGGPGGPSGPQGYGGAPAGPPPCGSSSASAIAQLLDSSSSADGSSTDGSSSDSTSLNNILQDFLKQLQDAQSLSYGPNGATTAASSLGSTLI